MLVPVFAILLLIAACGEDDDNGDRGAIPAGPEATASPTPPAEETPEPAPPEATPEPTPTSEPPATDTPAPPDATPTQPPDDEPAFDPEAVSLDVELVADGFNQPLFVTHAGDGSDRIFVVERGGSIRLLSGELLLDITGRVTSSGTEQGLLGLAFHPSFADNRWLYVNYTDLNGDTVVSRFEMTGEGIIDPGSEHIILTQEQPAGNHNGGMIDFGPDGYLYIGLGDGGGSYDTFETAQDLQSLLGKLLRIDVNAEDEPYAVPSDNPFVTNDDARPEIWAYGLRNPWRFAFDTETGDLHIADVGQNMFEWVHFQPAGSAGGENYGWPIFEGDYCLIEERCDEPGFVEPVAVYAHADGLGCAIIGGYVYRGDEFPNLWGAYLYSDLCSGNIWTLARDADGEWQSTLMPQIGGRISSFGKDESGNIYIIDLAGGNIYRIVDPAAE
jgi:glucose/arabinose dehydrogenase